MDHLFLNSLAALLDLLTATLNGFGLDYLQSDDVAPGLLLSGIPTCGFVVAFSGTLWRDAAYGWARVSVYVHVTLAAAGAATVLVGGWLSDQLSLYAATNTVGTDYFYTVPSAVAVAVVAGWPLLWAGVALVAWGLVRTHVWIAIDHQGHVLGVKPRGRQLHSILIGLALGFGFSVAALLTAMALALYTTPTSQSCCPRDYTFPARHGGQLDVVIFLGFVAITLGFFVAALVGARRVRERPTRVSAGVG